MAYEQPDEPNLATAAMKTAPQIGKHNQRHG